ncbi:MAG TPA: RNA polymerase sigma factor, partial [Thermoleophilaceae bacterium]|nr:RNA polymerase sigma factor [Thermoleophilaceae bacterium]
MYRRHHQRLFRYCLIILRDAEDAADALQTTMAKALSALEGGETVRGVRPWLFRIAYNTSIDTVRGRRPQVDLADLAETESSDLTAPSAASEAEDRAELVQAVADIQDLPDRQAGALVMRELAGLSYPDIAGAFDTSTGNARQLVHGARSALHAARRGRDMGCEVVRLALGEAEGRTPRDRRVRAHLASCADCRAFQRSIRTRHSALGVVVPPLAPWAATDILARLHADAGLAAGGGATAGALGKTVGASGATKLATGAAAVGTAVVVGGFVAGTGVLGGGGPGGSEPPGFLMPDAPELRPLPMPFPERAERRTPAREPAPAPTAARPMPPAVKRAAPVQRGPVSRVEPTVSDGGVESGGPARDDARPELGTVRRFGLPAVAGSVNKILDDPWDRLALERPGLFTAGGSIGKALAELLDRLNLRLHPAIPVKPKIADARPELGTGRRPELPASNRSTEKVSEDRLGRPNLRLDRAVAVKPKLRADRAVNRKPPADRDFTASRKSRVDTDVPVNRKSRVDTDVRVT